MNPTTWCIYDTPLMYDGNPPSSSTDVFAFSSSTCTFYDTPLALSGFTYGEIVNSVFLFSILVLVAFWSMAYWLTGTKIKKEH